MYYEDEVADLGNGPTWETLERCPSTTAAVLLWLLSDDDNAAAAAGGCVVGACWLPPDE